MKLQVHYHGDRSTELEYALDFLLNQRLGIAYSVDQQLRLPVVQAGKFIEFSYGKRCLRFPDTVFSRHTEAAGAVLEALPENAARLILADLPVHPPIPQTSLPVLFGQASLEVKTLSSRSCDVMEFGFDLVGTCFFFLSRYEEYYQSCRDEYDRFDMHASVAERYDLHLRPLVDEYTELLFATLQWMMPGVQRRRSVFNVNVSHDIDEPYLSMQTGNPYRLLRRMAGDLAFRHSPATAINTLLGATAPLLPLNVDVVDPFDTHDRLMDMSEEAGIHSSFFFQTHRQSQQHCGGGYNLDHPRVLALFNRVLERSHHVGMHPTGDAYKNVASFTQQADRFFQCLGDSGYSQDTVGGRHHFLQWRTGLTELFWSSHGFDFDSTIGYAKHVGFRCGTTHEFPLWNFENNCQLQLIEKPLMLMESTLFDGSGHMHLQPEAAYGYVDRVRAACQQYRGTMNVLWHNSNFTTPHAWDFYRYCLGLSK